MYSVDALTSNTEGPWSNILVYWSPLAVRYTASRSADPISGFLGSEYEQHDANQCAQECDAHAECVGFYHVFDQARCRLYTQDARNAPTENGRPSSSSRPTRLDRSLLRSVASSFTRRRMCRSISVVRDGHSPTSLTDVVENKRLGAALALAQTYQAQRDEARLHDSKLPLRGRERLHEREELFSLPPTSSKKTKRETTPRWQGR
jgi:hypothetical protein